ncbi:MAG: iron dependent repressor, metal binding and dimerization domain protein, partial [Planctomycetota bacterium]
AVELDPGRQVMAGAGGYLAATIVPALLGAASVNAAGSMTVMAGVLLVVAAVFSPTHGLVARVVRRRRLSRRSAVDDLLARLLRHRERGTHRVPLVELKPTPGLITPARSAAFAERLGLVRHDGDALVLTDTGIERATDVVRRHRQWETYLVNEAELRPDHVHDTAEQLEHLPVKPDVTDRTDPHGRPIPGK